ncbi:MAG: cysteine--tRNA ligase [Firmicutes bacterium]|nr:cysteine--tRNA ligase [Bacillota bacterium]
MYLYNTLTRKVEEFIPNHGREVKMYTCGPTVYHYAHIGNIRNYIGHDILEKTLKYLGYDVTRAMNITDVGHLTSDSDSGEDKMEVARKRENKTAMEIAKFYTEAFFKDFDKVNCDKPSIISPATDNIDMYIKIIEKLIKDDYAYVSGGNVYFDINKLDDYYVLTNHQEDNMVVGARDGVEEDNNKRNQADFALWFTTSKFENHELLWDSPWGKGYPGWHIECSGISIKYLGEYLDIHGGGVDNIFPHHTNEIAQSEAYLGHKWCNYWFHNEHLLDDSGKMSKSKGAILTVSLLEQQGYDPLAFRFMCLTSHYRKQLVFSYEALKQAETTLNKLRSRISNITEEGEFDKEKFDSYNNKFKEELSNDLNTANAITVLYDVLKDNSLNGKTKLELVNSFDQVFDVELIKKEIEIDGELKKYIEEKILERKEAKKSKDFEKADSIRDELLKKGVKLIDTREGTSYELI